MEKVLETLVGNEKDLCSAEARLVERLTEFLKIWMEKTSCIFTNSDEDNLTIFSDDYPGHYDWIEVFYIKYGDDNIYSVVKDEDRRVVYSESVIKSIGHGLAVDIVRNLKKAIEDRIESVKETHQNRLNLLDWLEKIIAV